MDQNKKDPERWRELADRASREEDPDKLLDLCVRLNQVLEENEKTARNERFLSGMA